MSPARQQPPESGWVKLNTDGASRGDPSSAAAGGLICNEWGRWLGGFVQNVGHASSVVTELWVFRCGLDLEWEKGFCRVILEVDSQVVLHFLSSRHLAIRWHGSLIWNISTVLM